MLNIRDYLKDKKAVILALFIVLGIFIRVQELGYSNLQGDEINPLDYIYEESFVRYIFAQKRGPLQYVINFVNTSLLGYINEAQIRLPYLIFALAAFISVYLLAKKLFGKRAALYALALMSINGLFVAFSRMAQYQAFLFFALTLSGLFFYRYFEEGRRKLLITSAAVYALCLLAHYDALSMAPFFALFIVKRFLENRKELKQLLKDSISFASIALVPNLLFYGAMRFNPYYEKVTSKYLGNRLLHGGVMPRIRDIMPIVSLYIPKHYLLVLLALLTIGLIGLRGQITEIKVWKFRFKRSFAAAGYVALCLILAGATIFSYYPIKPRTSSLLVIGASIGIITILLLSEKVKPSVVGLVGWFLFPYCVYFFLIRDPRTHIYTSFLPGFILAGYGVKWLVERGKNPKSEYLNSKQILNSNFQNSKRFGHLDFGNSCLFRIPDFVLRIFKGYQIRIVPNLLFATFIALLTFESGIIWQMFVDKNPEYPWWNKTALGWPIYKASHNRYDKPEGVFGVPYYRGWERFGEGVKNSCLKGSFYSNEKDSISYFYSRVHQVDKDKADNLVLIEGPHSWIFVDAEKEREGYTLIKTIKSKYGLPVMQIWGKEELYSEGELYCEF